VNGNGLALALACSEVLVVEGTTLAVDDLAKGMVPCAPVRAPLGCIKPLPATPTETHSRSWQLTKELAHDELPVEPPSYPMYRTILI